MKMNVKKYMIITILIAFFVCISYTYSDAMVVTTYADSPTPNKKLSKPKITVVKIDSIKNQTKAYNRICMSDEYEANNVKIYRKINNGKWKKIKTVKHYKGDYIGNRFVVYTDKVNKTKKNTKYRYRVKCNGDGWSRSKKYTNYSSTKSSTIGKKSFKIQLKNAATNRVYNTSYVRYGGKYIAPAKGQATNGYTFTGWTTKSLKNIKKGYIITAKYRVNSYTVTFKNGINSNTIATITKNYNSQIGDFPAAPSISGYTFTGWSGGTSSTRVTGNMTITANYTYSTPKQMQNITASNMTINVGQSQNIGATVNSGLTLTYTSNNASIASVNSNGQVTGNKVGNTTITIKQAGNSQYNAATKNITVTVNNNTSTNNSFKFTNVPSKVFTRPATENRNDIWDIEFEGSNIRSIQWSLEDYKNGLINSPGGANTVDIYRNTTTSPIKIVANEALDNNHNAGKFKVIANITYYDGSTQTAKSSVITNTVYKQNSDGSYNWENMSNPISNELSYNMSVRTHIRLLPKNSILHFDIGKMDINKTEFGDIRTTFTIDSTFNPLNKNYVLTNKGDYDILVLDGGGYSFNVNVKASSNSNTEFTYTVVLDGRNTKMYEFKLCLLSIQSATQGKSDIDKVRYILDYMSRNFTQASSEEQITGTGNWSGNLVGLFLKGRGNCSAYSGFFKAACDYCDIECYIRRSMESARPGGNHVNNAVIINNQKYVVESQTGEIVLWTDWLAEYPNAVWK